MKHTLCIVAALALCASAYGQTVRGLAYNISNNVVIGATNTNPLTWSNSFTWSTNTLSGATRSNLSLGWPALTNSNSATTLLGYNAGGTVIYSGTNQLRFSNAVDLSTGNTSNSSTGTHVDLALALWDSANDAPVLQISDGEVVLADGAVPQNFRVQLGIPWSGLTNTNSQTMRSALGLDATNGTGAVYAATAIWDAGDGGAAAWRIDDSDIYIRSAMASTNAPTNTTNVVRWLKVVEGTNNYRIPLYK